MQEVFENIIKALEEKRDEAEKNMELSDVLSEVNSYGGMLDAFDKAIEIVKQTATEYNNGWVPCSERLPEEHKLYDITFKNSAGIHSDSAIYNPYLKRWLWDADETELVENEILAWAEKREPYQPKGE